LTDWQGEQSDILTTLPNQKHIL